MREIREVSLFCTLRVSSHPSPAKHTKSFVKRDDDFCPCYPKPISPVYRDFEYLFVCEGRLYDVKTMAYINKAYEKNKNEILTLTTKQNKKISIDFTKMQQTEINNSSSKNRVSPVEQFRRFPQWFSKAADGTIKPYEHKLNAIICRAYVKKQEKVTTLLRKQEYELDLKSKLEINLENGGGSAMYMEEDFRPKLDCRPEVELIPGQETTEVVLDSMSPEYSKVADLFYWSMPVHAQLVKIEKILNSNIRRNWQHELENVKHANSNVSMNYTRMLFHGTGNCDPKIIYEGDKGFLINFASDGLWGRGVYFAQDAIYSHKYTFRTPWGSRKMILAEVITGDGITLDEDRTIRVPPPKDETGKKRFDCVIGMRHDTFIYICYDNGRAYPTYVIEYKFPEK